MSTGIVYLRPAPVLFVRVRGVLSAASLQAWAKLLGWADAKGVRHDISRAYGLVRDHAAVAGENEGRYDACIEAAGDLAEDHDAGIGLQVLPGGAYVRHRHTQGSATIAPQMHWLCNEWAPGRGVTVDGNRPLLEAYLTDPLDPKSGKLRLDLCVPILSTSQRRVA